MPWSVASSFFSLVLSARTAFPSLHAAYALLATLVLWRLVPVWARVLVAAYPVAMSFALVYTGEHYIVDCIAGWVYALFAYGLVTLDGSYHHQLSLDVGWIFFYLLWGAAALHPSMRLNNSGKMTILR